MVYYFYYLLYGIWLTGIWANADTQWGQSAAEMGYVLS